VCSNSIRATIQAMMERSSILPYLDFFLSNEDVSRSKPDPEIYSTAMRRFGLEPQECLIIEDNEHGIQAARASGGHVMVVGTVNDVTYDRILQEIARAEAAA
jgi:HAD superfamily hydrolase (TIGR01509 family)